MLRSSDRWGPFVAGLAPAERDARLRVLRAIVGLCCGERGREAQDAILRAERAVAASVAGLDDLSGLEDALGQVVTALRRLAGRDFRDVLGSYAGTSRMRTEPAPRQVAG